jgi:hypothetical protein
LGIIPIIGHFVFPETLNVDPSIPYAYDQLPGRIGSRGSLQETMTGWWLSSPTPLKNDGLKVSWDDDIPNIIWKIIKVMFQTTNQMSFLVLVL